MPGVTVTITNTANGRAQTLVTSSEGRYRVVALQPGPYEVAAELQGFAAVRREITLVVGADATLDVSLGVAALAETITVSGEAPLVEVASRSLVGDPGAQLYSLPVLSRNFLVLAQLLPARRRSAFGSPRAAHRRHQFGRRADEARVHDRRSTAATGRSTGASTIN